MKYDNDGYSDNEDILINNSNIYDEISNKSLIVSEIVELQLFINPVDGSVWKIKDEEMQPCIRYTYNSY
ncbi:MAG: hypothetical protein PHT02_00835 [Tissierellia bacterium]|nr:hypothetical protein [Tissierellia bacterium]